METIYRLEDIIQKFVFNLFCLTYHDPFVQLNKYSKL